MKEVEGWASRRNVRLSFRAVGSVLLLAGCANAPVAAPEVSGRGGAAPPASGAGTDLNRTVLAGVFTTAQAERGAQRFQQVCASCHSPAEFSGPVFQRIWTDRPVGELYHIISTMMPQNDPGGLSPQEYTDIISYFLRQNGYPAGQVELPADPEILDRVIFEPAD